MLFLVRARPATAQSSALVVTGDSDGDGFSDEQELAWNTDPHNLNSHPDLERRIVGWWPLDEGSGTTVTDASGNNLNGALLGAQLPTWTSDASGAALSFDGQHGAVIVPASSQLAPTSGVTVVAWVKISNGVAGTVAGQSTMDGNQSAYALSVINDRLAAQIRLRDADWPLYGHRVITDGQWHHLGFSYDGYEYALYLDGQLEVRTHLSGTQTPSSGQLVIGDILAEIRDVGVYARAIHDSELKLLHEVISTSTTALTFRQPSSPPFLFARRHERAPIRPTQIAMRQKPMP